MTCNAFRARLVSGVAAALLIGWANHAMAQDYPAGAYTAPAADPIDTLSAHLRTLASSPRNYLALIGAGTAALQVGDPNAALGFFARAEQVDPSSGRAKAGLASALVALERPDDALPLFAKALMLGVAEADIARDRGLAYDLRGDAKSAQRDYALALSRGDDDETVRRYALSLGISGDRTKAMALLDPLLRRRDQSAWRARAFILAMTGDVPGANAIAKQVMPANLAATMSPFLARLASLNPAARAHAVNFGTMPATGTQMASVEIGDPFRPIGGARPSASIPQGAGSATGTGLIPAGEPLGPKPVRVAEPLSNDPRRIPGRDPAPVQVASAAPVRTAPSAPSYPAPSYPAPAAPGFSVTPAPAPPSVDARFGERSSARIGPVDPAKLPPEIRDSGTPSVLVSPAKALPSPGTPPSVATAGAAAATVPAAAEPLVKSAPLPPSTVAQTPAFEVPAPAITGATATPSPAPVATVSVAPPSETPAPSVGIIGPPADGPGASIPASAAGEPAAAVAAAPAASAPAGVTPPPAAVTASAAVAAVAEAPPAPARPRLASVLDGITPEAETQPVALPTQAEIRAARRLAAKKAEAAAAAATAVAQAKAEKEAKAAEAAAAAAAAKANPARTWVQIATGSARGLTATWARLRDGNEKLLKGRSPWTAPYKSSARLLVGPMKSPADARALVTSLAKAGVGASVFSSEAGQEVARVGSK